MTKFLITIALLAVASIAPSTAFQSSFASRVSSFQKTSVSPTVRHNQNAIAMGTFVEEFKFKRFNNRFTFVKFAECLAASGMDAQIAGMGGAVTLFAPTDDAFGELGDAALAEIMADKERLTALCKFHMMAGQQRGEEWRLDNGKKLMTLQGSELLVDADGKSAYVDDGKVLSYDIATDEGLFHIIDWVNAPKKA